MILQYEIAFYLFRFYLYTEANNFIIRSSFKNKIRDDILRTSILLFSRFVDLNYTEGLVKWIKVIEDWDIMKESFITSPLGFENPNVQRVIDIAKDIIDQNKILTIDKLFSVSKRVLKIPQHGLISIIQFLIKNHVLIDGSKFSRESVLDNFLRKRILEYIRLNGCAHFSILRKEVVTERDGNLGSSGQLIWHLEMLLKFSYIKKIKVGNYTVFLPIEMEDELGIIIFLFRDKINRKIVDLLTAQNSVKNSDIFKIIDENRGKVNYRINNLIHYDILCSKEDTSKEIYVNPDKLENIIKILNKFKDRN